MKRLLFLLFTVVSACAQSSQVQLRVVTFEKTGAATALAAAAPDGDESLYTTLAAEAVAGAAVRVQDQTMTVRGGQRSKVEAVSEYPWLVGDQLHLETWIFEPVEFQFRAIGSIVEAEVTVGEKQGGQSAHPLDINVASDCPSLLTRQSWPVPDFRGAGQMGGIMRPVFGHHQISAQVIAWTGRTQLIGVTPGPSAPLLEKGGRPFRYTFLRAAVDGEKPVPASASLPMEWGRQRMHTLTFRLPRSEALALLRDTPGDRELFGSVKQLVERGTAELRDHTAMISRSGLRSKISHGADIEYVADYSDLVPREWQSKLIGSTLEVQARGSYDKPVPDWQIALTQTSAAEYVPLHPSAKHPALHGVVVEYDESELSTGAIIAPGRVVCAAITSNLRESGEDAGDFTDITFLQAVHSSGESKTANIRMEAMILSLPAGAEPKVKRGDPAGPLLKALTAEGVRCISHAGLVLQDASKGKVRAGRVITGAAASSASAVNDEVTLPDSFDHATCGISLEVECAAGPDITTNGALTWDSAPPRSFGEPGDPIPSAEARRVSAKFQYQALTLVSGQPLVADVQVSTAPAGTPEHNRRHVVVLRARHDRQ